MLELEPKLTISRLLLQVHDSLVFETIDGPGIGRQLEEVTAKVNPLSISMPWTGKPWDEHD